MSENLNVSIEAHNNSRAALQEVRTDIDAAADAGDRAAKGGLANLRQGITDISKIAGGVVLAGAITQAPGFLFDAAKGAAADEQATARLNTALEKHAQVTGASNTQLESWKAGVDDAIAAGQDLAFTDDEVRDSFQFLLAATGDTDESMRRMAAAQDLARGANIPLATATKMLGKLSEENVEVFKKLGITIGDNATEADALAAVQAKFGGQAEAYASSTAGQFEKTQIAMAELQESIGTLLLPVMLALGTVVGEVLIPVINGALVPAIAALGTGIAFVVDNSNIFLPILIGIGAGIAAVVLPMLISMIPVLAANAAGWWAVAAGAIAANLPIIATVAVIALLVAGIILLIQNWDTITAKLPILGTAFEAVKTVIQGTVDWVNNTLIPVVTAIGTAVVTAASTAIDFVKQHWGEIEAVIMPAIETIRSTIETAFGLIQIYIETAVKVVTGIFQTLSALLRGDFSGAWNEFKETISDAMEGAKKAILLVVEFIEGLIGRFGTAGKDIGTALLTGLKDALTGAAGFVSDVAAAVRDAVRGVINDVIGRFNRALEFEIVMPGGIPNFHVNPPDIPSLARGGITQGPTLALIGDNPGGREAVIPLGPGQGLPGGAVINIYALDGESVRRAIPTIMRELKAHARRTGDSLT